MTQVKHDFGNNFPVNEVFASEALIRLNRSAFRGYCYHILDKRQLPLANVALGFYIRLVEETDIEIRKDQLTPREQHEESHLITLDALLKITGDEWINEKEYGSVDVLFTACILHDVIEDLKISEKAISDYLSEGILRMFENNIIPEVEYIKKSYEIDQAVKIVYLLSRKDENGAQIEESDRIKQAKKWLEHPYAYVIKMIDWSNKLQTMAGVEHFEKNDLKKMGKVLNETSLIFVDEQQGFTQRAIEKYPFLETVCEPLEGVMGMLFQTLNTYKKLKTQEFEFDPRSAFPFNFQNYLNKAKKLISALPTGNNYVAPLIERLDAIAEHSNEVRAFINHMVRPAFKNFESVVPAFKHS